MKKLTTIERMRRDIADLSVRIVQKQIDMELMRAKRSRIRDELRIEKAKEASRRKP